jgi:hypothetical protein
MKHFLSACMMFRNDHQHLPEWLEYHRLVGVDHFYIINNDKDPRKSNEVLKPYVDEGCVTIFNWNKDGEMLEYYGKVLEMAETEWLAFIDLDEFLYPVQYDSVAEVVKQYHSETAGLLTASWYCYGSSHLVSSQEFQVESFVWREEAVGMKLHKSILRPEAVSCMVSPHIAVTYSGYDSVNENLEEIEPDQEMSLATGQHIRINHYIVRSLEDFKEKIKRGGGDGVKKDWNYWHHHDVNEVYDDEPARRFGPRIREALRRRGRRC